jgi:amino acid permease
MTKKNRLNIAIAAAFGYLIATELIGTHLPSWLNWLAFPSSLIGGAFIFAGPFIGLLIATVGATILTALSYWLIGFFIEAPSETDTKKPPHHP